MTYTIKFKTAGGGKRELDVKADSPLSAEEAVKELYPGCEIISLDLSPTKNIFQTAY